MMEIQMKDKKMMFDIFKHHGPFATSIYIKKHGKKYIKDEIIHIAMKSEPYEDALIENLPKIVQKLHSLIGTKAEVFYHQNFERPNFSSSENAFLPTLPLETFLDVSRRERLNLFFESLKMYDIMIGRVIALSKPCFILSLLCFTNGKCRQIDDLDYRVHLPCNRVHGIVSINDFVKVAIVGCGTKQRHVYVSADEADLPEDFNGTLPKLGIVTPNDFPPHYKFLLEGSEDPYNSIMKVEHFLDPYRVDRMMAAFGFNRTDVISATNLGSRGTYAPEEYASSIRAKHIIDLAKMHNEEGLDFILKNKPANAINSFNKSIELDSVNILAFLHLGTTYMALKNYEKAVKMLEKVLELQPNYEQAHLFLSKAVFYQAKIAVSQNDKGHAVECCKKAIKFNSGNAVLHRKLMELLFDACAEEELSSFATLEKEMDSQTVDAESTNEGELEIAVAVEKRIEGASALPTSEPIPSPIVPAVDNVLTTNRSNVEEAELALKCNEFVQRIKLPDIEPDKEGKAEKRKSRRAKRRHRSRKKKKHRTSRSSGDKDTSLDDISSEEDDSIYSQAKEDSPNQQVTRSDKQDSSRSPSPKAYSTTSRERRSNSSDRQRGSRRRRRHDSDSSSSSGFDRRRRHRSRSLSEDRYRSSRRHGRRSRSSSSDRYRSRRRRTRSSSMEWRSVSPKRSTERKANFDLRQRLRKNRSPSPESGSKHSHRARSPSIESISLDRISNVSQDHPSDTELLYLRDEHFRPSSYISSSKKPAISIINEILSKTSQSLK